MCMQVILIAVMLYLYPHTFRNLSDSVHKYRLNGIVVDSLGQGEADSYFPDLVVCVFFVVVISS